MERQTEFQTTDLDLAAAIMTATGHQPQVSRQTGNPLLSFQFPNNEDTMSTVVSYAGGDLVLPARRFASCRSWLYRKAKGVAR